MQIAMNAPIHKKTPKGTRGPAATRQYIDEEILDRDPDNAMGFFLRGQTLQQEFHHTEAIRDYELALEKVRNEAGLCADIALRILSLAKAEPQYSRDAMIPVLDRAYGISKDVRLANEIAKICEMQDKKDQALEYYEKVFHGYTIANQIIWEEAVLFISQLKGEKQGPEASLKFIREALTVCPESKVLARSEQALAVELGEVRVKTRRLPRK